MKFKTIVAAALAVVAYRLDADVTAKAASPFAIIPDAKVRGRFDRFSADDEEIYATSISNREATDWARDAVPRFECPDEEIVRTYYFRWWTYRKHLRRTKDGKWVVTEFLPDVCWAGAENTIACPLNHHLNEGRWLRKGEYLDDYLAFVMARGSLRAYAAAPAWGASERAKVTGDMRLAQSLLTAFVANFEAWEKGWQANSLSLTDPEVRSVRPIKGVAFKAGFRADRGLFDLPGICEGSEFALSADGARPLVNSLMWAEAVAIAEIARAAGDAALADRFAAKAAVLERNVKARLWNPSRAFFTALAADGRQDDVCELNGYAPFAAGMPLGREDFARLMGLYARQHRRTLEDGRTVAWIDENLSGFTGEWLARDVLVAQAKAEGREPKPRERGKDYNHSTFCDLVITGLCGFVPQADGALKVDPLAPAAWDWWCLDGVRYHGRDVTVLFDRDGAHYGRGKGLLVLNDGKSVRNPAVSR